jgi:hypothetical protein
MFDVLERVCTTNGDDVFLQERCFEAGEWTEHFTSLTYT